MDWTGLISLRLEQPLLALAALPVLLLIIWQLARGRRGGVIPYAGLEYAVDAGVKVAADRRRFRRLLVLTLILSLALAWASPGIRTSRPLPFGPAQQLYPTMLIALDVSGSMTEPLGGYVIDGRLNTGGITRFEAAQGLLKAFIGRHAETRFGLILFSVRPMLVRWPTVQTDFDFRDVLDEGMRYTNRARQRPSQLARFAGGTATRAGLLVAGDVLDRQGAAARSLVLIGDLIDNTQEIIEGIKAFDLDDTYVHVVAMDPEPQSLETVTAAFDGEPNVRVYPAVSVKELEKVFTAIESVELDRHGGGGGNYVQDMRWFMALLGFFLALAIILLFETKLHKTTR